MAASLQPIHTWFDRQGWEPLPFQRQTWQAYLEGRSGLIQVPTGSGKTFAAVMGPIARMLQEPVQQRGIRLLYLTPLRALRWRMANRAISLRKTLWWRTLGRHLAWKSTKIGSLWNDRLTTCV